MLKNSSDLPNFLIIGVPKAGTSSLHRYLSQHPEIFMSNVKEPRFFDTVEFDKGIDFYRKSYFSGSNKWKIRGEATPSYFFHSEAVIPRILDCLGPDLKVIVVFRDPVARAWSHYLHARALCIETVDFPTALSCEEERILSNPLHWVSYFSEGLYADRLAQWFNVFGRNSVMPLLTEDLRDHRVETLRSVLDFLGVDSSVNLNLHAEYNSSPTVRSAKLMRWLNVPSRSKDLVKVLMPNILRRPIADLIGSLNLSRASLKAPMPREIAYTLRQRYSDDIKRLESLISRDLTKWRINDLGS
jgi:hypothetical protein